MPFNSQGEFTPAVTFFDGTPALAEDQNTQDSDIANGLTQCLTRAGLAPATANIPMGGFKLTGLGVGSAPTDSVNYSQVSAILPSGIMVPYEGSTAPAGWLLCYGQAVSRTTYANLFVAIGTTYGSGDGSTTFNLPDWRGNAMAGADNIGGTPANRLTGYVNGTMGGNQAVTLTASQLPTTAYQDSGHTHPVSDPGHSHPPISGQFMGTPGPGGPIAGGGSFTYEEMAATGSSSTGLTVSSGTASISNPGGGQSHANVQSTLATNVIIKT